jgi:hypothetical protein
VALAGSLPMACNQVDIPALKHVHLFHHFRSLKHGVGCVHDQGWNQGACVQVHMQNSGRAAKNGYDVGCDARKSGCLTSILLFTASVGHLNWA